jgi:hypothetical protein
MDMSIRCNFCQGPAHPATGCVYGPKTIACYRCTREFWAWATRHINGKARANKNGVTPGVSFYEAAARR